MTIDLVKLQNTEVTLDNPITLDLTKYPNKSIKALNNLYIKGRIYYNSLENLCLDLTLTGDMILIDSITLDDISYPLNLKIEEEYEINPDFLQVYTINNQNTLDILKILWENIVLEVPIRITNTKNAKLSGDGWSLGYENKNNDVDPRLAKLKELLDD